MTRSKKIFIRSSGGHSSKVAGTWKPKLLLFASTLALACGPDMATHRPVAEVVGVEIWTGDEKDAGTDANVCIQALYEGSGEGRIYRLYQLRPPNVPGLFPADWNFERRDKNVVPYHPGALGPIRKLRLGHDNTGNKPGWFVERLELKVWNRQNRVTYPVPFIAGRWLAVDEGDRAICVELERTALPKACTSEKARTFAAVCRSAPLSS